MMAVKCASGDFKGREKLLCARATWEGEIIETRALLEALGDSEQGWQSLEVTSRKKGRQKLTARKSQW